MCFNERFDGVWVVNGIDLGEANQVDHVARQFSVKSDWLGIHRMGDADSQRWVGTRVASGYCHKASESPALVDLPLAFAGGVYRGVVSIRRHGLGFDRWTVRSLAGDDVLGRGLHRR